MTPEKMIKKYEEEAKKADKHFTDCTISGNNEVAVVWAMLQKTCTSIINDLKQMDTKS